MRGFLHIDPGDSPPIWRQIESGMERLIRTSALAPGTGVPSVRELARDLQVNPATVVKAYQRLVDAGLLVVKRGDGTYVAEIVVPLQAADRRALLREAASRFTTVAHTAGAEWEEVQDALKAAWNSPGPESKGVEP